ncbi:hypothetical protein GCM10022202_26410 [Microbacterium marinilacus]|uniref:Uncharacterized protein n=2 Tax=Microbacterium marinilacus TaxID=415209 RepID=A0ABP7BMB6_9MICO
MDVGSIILAAGVMLLLLGAVLRYRKEKVAWRTPAIVAMTAVPVNILLDVTTDLHPLVRWLLAIGVGLAVGGLDSCARGRRSGADHSAD